MVHMPYTCQQALRFENEDIEKSFLNEDIGNVAFTEEMLNYKP